MKKEMRRALCIFLCMTMLAPNASVWAAEKNAADGTWKSMVNPLYKNVLDETAELEELTEIQEYVEKESENLARSAITVCSTGEEASAYLCEQMVAREEAITFLLSYNYLDCVGDIVKGAWKHTEECAGTEGDALLWVWKASGYQCVSYSSEYMQVICTMTYYTTAEQEDELTEAVNIALDEMQMERMSANQKIITIHDYICEHVDYDDDYYEQQGTTDNYLPHTAYAALCQGKAVCQGYAVLFYRFCKEAGVPVRVIAGTSQGENHGWNIAKIGKYYYNIDTTWDGQDSITYDTYLLKSESDFAGHNRFAEYATAEFCAQYPMAPTSWTAGAEFIPITLYDGVDYAAVYDYEYYMDSYDNLNELYGNDSDGALEYFVNYGMDLGHQASEEFNVYTYRKRYADLRCGYRNDLKEYYMHYLNYGKAEGRSGAGEATLIGENVYQGVDYSAVYNYEYYMNEYPDLASVYGVDDYAALQHFVEHGMAEGRVASDEFNVYTYRNRYIDLRRGYKDDLRGYYMHYILSGKAEGRSGAGEATLVGETVYQDVDYSSVYSFEYYMNKYPDLAGAFGSDEYASLQHFVEHGMDEGRQGSAEFNVIAYRNRYDDLCAGYGNDNKGYYLHYLYSGKAEGRDGSDLKESDYAAVYNYETYLALNPDIQESYGNDRNAVLQHFVGHGMLEGRQASKEFNVYAYMNRYEDLKAGFGNDLKGYYLHYINSGVIEGRNARSEEMVMLGEEH